ncbi:MAG: hypothetical protein M3P91_02005 [Actinomycetota bacterium]|nr:hypothetical protein [Actinomycetota bacterium]
MPADHPRPLRLPPHKIAEITGQLDPEGAADAELRSRLYEELAALGPEHRAAVVAALGYAEGPVGAAMEVGCDVAEGARLTEDALEQLRQGMRD